MKIDNPSPELAAAVKSIIADQMAEELIRREAVLSNQADVDATLHAAGFGRLTIADLAARAANIAVRRADRV